MRLIIVRHAAAEQRDTKRWPDDSKRPLTDKGERRFAALAKWLGQTEPKVDLVLSSRWSRAWRTAELLTEHAGWPSPTAEATLELAPADEIIDALPRRDDITIVVVGHEPTLSKLVSLLLTGTAGRLAVRMKKGAAVCINFDQQPMPGSGELHWMVTPKMLR